MDFFIGFAIGVVVGAVAATALILLKAMTDAWNDHETAPRLHD